eukprot:TRINITY_DN103133_c0_g1_i1.p1 TRINITY_DN103133_c0_g1~~TRINITY_DN103133_c0_g1_i1.p1  ORF type:complete len:375 (-),score=114.99 TRINITY_DN103133_c0_g1_i1:86-1210(-)
MARQYRPRSTVKKTAQCGAKVRGKLKEKKQIVDPKRTTFGKVKGKAKDEPLPEASKESKKGQFEKIPGTRVELVKTGVYVRKVVEDGKTFPPDNVRGCRQHLRKLQEKAAEIARTRGEAIPVGPLAKEAKKNEKRKPPAKGADKAEPLSKKARKQQDYEMRQKRLADEHAAKVAGENRQLVSEAWCFGEVVERSKGCAWVKLRQSEQHVPEEALKTLRAENASLREAAGTVNPFCGGAEGDLLRLAFADVSQTGLNLRPGTKVTLRVFKTGEGSLGGCEAKEVDEATSAAAAAAAAPAAMAPAASVDAAKADVVAEAQASEDQAMTTTDAPAPPQQPSAEPVEPQGSEDKAEVQAAAEEVQKAESTAAAEEPAA